MCFSIPSVSFYFEGWFHAAELCCWCGTWKGDKVCGSCKKARYCSKMHQAAHWQSAHKINCRTPVESQSSTSSVNGEVRKVAKLPLWKQFAIVNEEESDITGSLNEEFAEALVPQGHHESIESLMSNFEGDADKKTWVSFQDRISWAPEQVLRLLLDADNVPIVLPFVHTGMQEVMPIGAKVPRIGKTVTVLVGDPIRFDDILNAEQKKIISRVKLYDAICTRIGDNLRKLKAQVERLAIEQSLKLQNYPTKVTERSAKILQQIDWESLSKESENNSSEMVEKRYGVNSLENQNFSTSLFGGGGIVSRIKGYRDSVNLMGLAAAREMFRNYEVKNDVLDQGLSPLKAWNYFLERNCNYSPVTFLAANYS